MLEASIHPREFRVLVTNTRTHRCKQAQTSKKGHDRTNEPFGLRGNETYCLAGNGLHYNSRSQIEAETFNKDALTTSPLLATIPSSRDFRDWQNGYRHCKDSCPNRGQYTQYTSRTERKQLNSIHIWRLHTTIIEMMHAWNCTYALQFMGRHALLVNKPFRYLLCRSVSAAAKGQFTPIALVGTSHVLVDRIK